MSAEEDNPFIRQLREQYALNTRVFVQLADELRKEGQLDEAIALCRDGMREHPRFVHARITLGRALAEQGQLEEARYELETALAALPQSLLAHRALGDCLEQMGDVAGAKAHYRSALVISPDSEDLAARLRALEALPDEPPPLPSEPMLELPEERRGPDPDLPPLPLVAAEETFELEKPYDIPSVWQDGQTMPKIAQAPASQPADDPPPAVPEEDVIVLDETEVAEAPATGSETPPGSGDAAVSRKPVVWPARRLAESSVPELIQALYARGWTGVLVLGRGGIEKTLRFRDGRVEFAYTSDPDERMGEVLLRRGRITLDQYVGASGRVRKGRRFGAALVELGVLTQEELVETVLAHAERIIYGAFEWSEGLYQLREGVEVEPEEITVALSTPQIILNGFEHIRVWSRILRGVGSLDSVYARTQGPAASLDESVLSAEQREILEHGAEPSDVATICRRSSLADFDVCRTLWAFRVLGAMQRVSSRG